MWGELKAAHPTLLSWGVLAPWGWGRSCTNALNWLGVPTPGRTQSQEWIRCKSCSVSTPNPGVYFTLWLAMTQLARGRNQQVLCVTHLCPPGHRNSHSNVQPPSIASPQMCWEMLFSHKTITKPFFPTKLWPMQ